jgi:hypothetical protein
MSLKILSNLTRWLAPAVISLGLAACGSGSGGGTMSGPTTSPQGCSTCGSAQITLTDAAGDFASYTVDVTSLKLTKADGTVVETLPVKTRVDFAQLVNVSELLTAASVPQGEYVSASITLDYSNAAIFVYTNADNSQQAKATKVVDGSGNTLFPTPPAPASSSIALMVKLDDKNHLFITPGKLARLALDFNLAASNSADLTDPANPVVTVQAFIVASVVPTDTKEIRVRGTLASVDLTGGTYTVTVQPFDDEHEDRGQVVVHTTDQTSYEIDGTSYAGSAGLTALNAEPAGTMTVAFGTLSKTDHTFTASRVLAGTSVESSSSDRLHGVVIARSGDTLVVRGGSMWSHDDDEDKHSAKDVTLSIGDATKITVDGDSSAMPTKLWPSVGSRITAFGKSGTDAMSGNPTFDATAGHVRLELTSLWGTETQVGTGSVTLNLQAIEGNPPTAFNFAGTGGTASGQHDSDPMNYVVATGALPLTDVGSGAPLRFLGLVQPFGSAQPDFNARTLVNFTDTSALLSASFGDGSIAALTASTTSLVLNVSDPLLGWLHFIKIGPQRIDLKTLPSNVTIAADPASMGPFAIRTGKSNTDGMNSMSGTNEDGTVNVYNSFADFEAQLASALGAGAKVALVLAVGHYDQTANTLTATQIAIDLR